MDTNSTKNDKLTETLETSSDPDYIAPGYSHIDSWHDSAATPAVCSEEDCETCDQHYRPVTCQEASKIFQYHECLTDNWAVYKIRDLMQSAQTDLKHVASRLELRGNAIIRRWRKKSVEKRIGLLRAVMPDMPEAPFSLLYQQKRSTGEDRTLFHELWLLTYLDLQTLSEHPTRLLSMLHYRTHYSAEKWFRHDAHQLRVPFAEGFLHIAYNPHAIVAQGERFGDLQQWNLQAAHRWDLIGLPRALATFEAQAKLANFLRVFVDRLVEDEPPVGNDAWLALVEGDFAKSTSSSEDVLSGALGRPFGKPPSCDLVLIKKVLEDRFVASREALLRVQIEPGRVCWLLDRARSSEWLGRQSEFLRNDQYLRGVLGYLERNERLEWLVHHAGYTVQCAQDCVSGVLKEYGYVMALEIMRSTLETFLRMLTYDLHGLVAIEPQFEHHQRYCTPGYPDRHITDDIMFTDDPLYWALCRLQERGRNGLFNDDKLLGMLSGLLSQESHRKRISHEVYAQLKDISAVSEALVLLDHHFPHVPGKLKDSICLACSKVRPTWADWDFRCSTNGIMVSEQPVAITGPLCRLSLLPSTSTAEDSAITQYTKAQVTLKQFWARVREGRDALLTWYGLDRRQITCYLAPIAFSLSDEAYAKLYTASKSSTAARAADLAPFMPVVAWSDPRVAVSDGASRADDMASTPTIPKAKVTSWISPSENNANNRSSIRASSFLAPSSQIQTVWGENSDPEPVSVVQREEVKTRPTNSPILAEIPIVPATPDRTPAPRHTSIVGLYEGSIVVSAQSFDLFLRMFTPIETHKGTPYVPW
ncbi:hypothetical protein LTS10_012215 [Elasticomyces elasticus]|nr:hypothetical protein LTS10_012215 [Elasticomyces elasticus]